MSFTRSARARLALFSFLAVATLVVAAGFMFTSRQVDAQDVDMADHPVVGSWILTADGEPSLIAFTADGVIVDVEADRSPGVGAWAMTGPDTASATIAVQNSTPEFGFEGTIIIRAVVTANDDGTSLTVDYSLTGMLADGTVVFDEAGSGTAIPFPIEAPDASGQPLTGYPTIGSDATPSS